MIFAEFLQLYSQSAFREKFRGSVQNSFDNNVVLILADTCNVVHVWSMAQPRATVSAGLAKLFLTSRYNSHKLYLYTF